MRDQRVSANVHCGGSANWRGKVVAMSMTRVVDISAQFSRCSVATVDIGTIDICESMRAPSPVVVSVPSGSNSTSISKSHGTCPPMAIATWQWGRPAWCGVGNAAGCSAD